MKDVVEQARSSDAVLFSGIAAYVELSAAEYLGIPAIGLGVWSISLELPLIYSRIFLRISGKTG